ncbi:MAG: hypothetical protein ACOC9X_01385, partial [bacterium]
MTRQIQFLVKAFLLTLFLLVPALLTVAQRAPDSRAPSGAALFVDSGQPLGDVSNHDLALGDVDGAGGRGYRHPAVVGAEPVGHSARQGGQR